LGSQVTWLTAVRDGWYKVAVVEKTVGGGTEKYRCCVVDTAMFSNIPNYKKKEEVAPGASLLQSIKIDAMNEWGTGIDDLIKRLDAEYWMPAPDDPANPRYSEWKECQDRMDREEQCRIEHEMQELDHSSCGNVDEELEESVTLDESNTAERLGGSKGGVSGEQRQMAMGKKIKTEKVATIGEIRRKILKDKEEKEVRKTVSKGKKMRKEGKMRAINTYFYRKKGKTKTVG
jgi:hypothetical protein